jgi:hypothetical protein
LVFLRASGHTLDHVGTLPRQLLRYVGERLDLPTPTIASLRTLYQRYRTQYEHQIWACEYLGLRGQSRRAIGRNSKHGCDEMPPHLLRSTCCSSMPITGYI